MNKIINQLFLGIVIGLLFSGLIIFISSKPDGNPIIIVTPTHSTFVYVHVDGAVTNPGVYKVPRYSRGFDAVELAGGLLEGADTSNINLATLVKDGSKITIPAMSDAINPSTRTSGSDVPVNINTASVSELDSLPDIGLTKAQTIVDYREENGLFQSIEDILNVPGIGPVVFDKISTLITVD